MIRGSRTVGAITLLCLGVACTADEPESVVTTDTSPATTAVSVGTTSTTEPGPPSIRFTRVDDPSFEGGVLNGVVAGGPGYVAVGSDEVPQDAAVWVSADGVAWTRVESGSFSGVKDDLGLEGAQAMNDVAIGLAGIVAVGSYERRESRDVDAGVWFSPDGLVWERVDDPSLGGGGTQVMHSVATWNGMFVAVGETAGPVGSGEGRPALWTSADGRTWEQADGIVFRLDSGMRSVIDAGSQVIAVGRSGHVARPTAWISSDGLAWNAIGFGEASTGTIGVSDAGRLDDVFMNAVAASPSGFVAGGAFDEPSEAVFWRSDDGIRWEVTAVVADYERPGLPVSVEAMAATDRGIVAAGTARFDSTRFPPLSLAEVWVSEDVGVTWNQVVRTTSSLAVDGPGAPWHVGGVHDLIATDDVVLMVGFVPNQGVTLPGPFFRPAVWIGEWR